MLSLRKFNLLTASWSAETVTYRNTLLGLLYPELDIAIGDVSGFVKSDNPDLPAAIAAMSAGFEEYQLVGASGARKKGQALFVRGKHHDCFSRFFGSEMGCINYGSNLVTECKDTFEMSVSLLVVPDGEYGTGDCHGKCSSKFALGVVGQLQQPFQFRAAVKEELSWVAKGTIAFSFDCGGYDLVLPESCFKGNKVTPGAYSIPNFYFGVVHVAEVRHVKMSYSVTQYLPWSAVEADILPGTVAAAKKLVHLQSHVRSLANYLCADIASDCDIEEMEEPKYVSPLSEIISADVHGQLIEHPWVVRHVRELVRKRWTRLATAGAVAFNSVMVMPDDSLPDNTVCVPHLPEGDVIVFPYPCRWKHDIQVWRNVHQGNWSAGYEGIIAGSHATMLKLGRDQDGDFMQVLPASKLPNVAAAARDFGEAPQLTKPAKQKVTGTLAEIAVRSMDNCVGLITYLIAKAWASDNHYHIPRLAQELQIEVDSLKNVQRADRDYLAEVGKAMSQSSVQWLKDHKEPEVFATRSVAADGDDTISRLAAIVNNIWQPLVVKERSLIEFRDLFPASFPESWRQRATLRRDEYNSTISTAAKSGDDSALVSVVKSIRDLGDRIPHEHKSTAAAAFWHTCHVQKSGTASFVFHAFIDQIKQQLSEQRFSKLTIVGSKYWDFASHIWNGEDRGITISQCTDPRFDGRLVAMVGSKIVGLLADDSAKLPVGSTHYGRLNTVKGSVFVALVPDEEVEF